ELVLDVAPVADRLTVDADVQIAGREARATRGRLRVDHADERHERRMRDADAALHLHVAVALAHRLLHRRDVALEVLAVARDPELELLAGRALDDRLDVLP